MLRVEKFSNGTLLVPPLYRSSHMSIDYASQVSGETNPYTWYTWSAYAIPALFNGSIDIEDRNVGFLHQGPGIVDRKGTQGYFKDVEHFKLDGTVRNIDIDRKVNIPMRYVNVFNNDNFAHISVAPQKFIIQRYCGKTGYPYTASKPLHDNYAYYQYEWMMRGDGILSVCINDTLIASPEWNFQQYGIHVKLRVYNASVAYYRLVNRFYNTWNVSILGYPDPIYFEGDTPSEVIGSLYTIQTRLHAFALSHLDEMIANPTYSSVKGTASIYVNGTSAVPDTVLAPVSLYFPEQERNPDWNELAREAYQDLGFYSGNGIALAGDVVAMNSAVRSTMQTIKSLGKSKVKAVAQLYLSFHYGWKLLALDVKDLADTLAEYSAELHRCQAATHLNTENATVEARYQCYYTPYSQLQGDLRRLTALLDMDLRTGIAWDMIPYSFVIDWFIQIGDVLTAIDNFYNLRQKHDVLAAGRSIRCTRFVTPDEIGMHGMISVGLLTLTYYHRAYQRNPIEPSLFPSVTHQFSLQHVVEGSALVVSRV